MSEASSKPPDQTFDLKSQSLSELHSLIQTYADQEDYSWKLLNPDGLDYLGCRWKCSHHFLVQGPLGDYCFSGMEGPHIEIDGDIDSACGQAIQAGSIVIRGNAGSSLGSFGKGGWIAVHGIVGPRCGAGLTGSEIIVRGNAGPQLGYGMQAGTIVIGGAAGANLGQGMSGGTVYVRGAVESLASGIEEIRIKETDRFKLGLLMLKAGLKGASSDYRGYRKADG